METARSKLESSAGAAMIEPEDLPAYSDEQLYAIYRRSPVGAFALAGISTLIVFLLWLLFYVLVFLPRGMLK